jgi:uncharacterized protein YbcI
MYAGLGDEPPEGGELRQAISDLAVRVFADHLERGPTKVRTLLDGDIVLCLLEETMTRAERKLVDSGRERPALTMRTALRETMSSALVEGVEELTGHRVTALVSGSILAPDVTSALFVLGERRR